MRLTHDKYRKLASEQALTGMTQEIPSKENIPSKAPELFRNILLIRKKLWFGAILITHGINSNVSINAEQ